MTIALTKALLVSLSLEAGNSAAGGYTLLKQTGLQSIPLCPHMTPRSPMRVAAHIGGKGSLRDYRQQPEWFSVSRQAPRGQ